MSVAELHKKIQLNVQLYIYIYMYILCCFSIHILTHDWWPCQAHKTVHILQHKNVGTLTKLQDFTL